MFCGGVPVGGGAFCPVLFDHEVGTRRSLALLMCWRLRSLLVSWPVWHPLLLTRVVVRWLLQDDYRFLAPFDLCSCCFSA